MLTVSNKSNCRLNKFGGNSISTDHIFAASHRLEALQEFRRRSRPQKSIQRCRRFWRHRGHWLQQRRPQLLHRSCWRPLRSCRRQRFSQNLLPKWMSRSSLLFFPCPEIFCKCSKLSNLSNDFLVTSGGNPTFFFKKMGHSGLFFFYFRLFNTIQLTVDNKCSIKFCRCLESNREPLVPEATALPTEPQPLPTGNPTYR